MKDPKNIAQKGFSLVELIVVSVIFGFVAVAIASVTLAVYKSDARLNEQSELTARTAVVTDLLYTDFADPLRLLSSSEQTPATTFAAVFENHSDYELSPGYARRISNASARPLVSSAVLSEGNATASFVPPPTAATFGWHTVGSDFNTNFFTLHLNANDGGGSQRAFDAVSASNGQERNGVIESSPDKIEARVERLSVGCRLAFYAVYSGRPAPQLLARSIDSCPPLPLEVVATTESVLTNMEFTGSFKPRRAGVSLAPLPYVGSEQMTSPVSIIPENQNLVLFKAADGEDKTFLAQPASFELLQETTIVVSAPLRGNFEVGGELFVVDYAGGASILCRITSVGASTGREINLTLTPVYDLNSAAWGLFYSRPEDFQGKTFAVGSEVIKIAAPISYRLVPQDNLLQRRVGSRVWETVAPGVSKFSLTTVGDTLKIVIGIENEGIETDGIGQGTKLSIPIR